MGNTLLDAKQKAQSLRQLDVWLEQYNSEIMGKENIFENKIFKTYKFHLKSHQSYLILKIYLKENGISNLDIYRDQFNYIMKAMSPFNYTNILPFMKLMNFDIKNEQDQTFLAIGRQSMKTTLKDRFFTAPYLTEGDKNYIMMQVIIALYSLHGANLYHGSIKSSNILLSSFNHVWLTDMASYKPYYISELSQYNLFYDSNDQICYLAPEKFDNQRDKIPPQSFEKFPQELLINLQKMDIFSLGCIIYEIYQDEKGLFDYETIHQYSSGQFQGQYEQKIKNIQNKNIKELVMNLTNIKPQERMDINDILKYWFDKIIDKNIYGFLFYIDAILISNIFAQPDLRISLIKHLTPILIKQYLPDHPLLHNKYCLPLTIQSFPHSQRLKIVLDGIYPLLSKLLDIPIDKIVISDPIIEDNNTLKKTINYEYMLNMGEKQFKQSYQQFTKKKDRQPKEQVAQKQIVYPKEIQEAFKIMIGILCSNLRNVKFEATRLVGIEILAYYSDFLNDYDNLHLVLPYVFEFLEDTQSNVVSYAYQVFVNIIYKIKYPFSSKTDTILFKDFIWEKTIIRVSKSTSLNVQATFALNITKAVKACYKFCDIVYEIKSDREKSDLTKEEIARYMIDHFINKAKLISELGYSSEKVNFESLDELYNLLQNVGELFEFLYPYIEQNPDVLYVIQQQIISCINKNELKIPILQNLPSIILTAYKDKKCDFLPLESMLICCENSLNDSNALIVYQAVKFFRIMSERNLFDQKHYSRIIGKIAPLILYPHKWIRDESIAYIEIVLSKYNPFDIMILFQQKLIPYLTQDVQFLNQEIFKMIIPKMLDKPLLELKQLIIREYPQDIKQQSQYKYLQAFYDNYLKDVKFPEENQDKSSKKIERNVQEIVIFKEQISEINQQKQMYQNICQKTDNFLVNSFKYKIDVVEAQVKKEYFLLNYLGVDKLQDPLKLSNQQIKNPQEDIITQFFINTQISYNNRSDLSIYRQRILAQIYDQLINNIILQQGLLVNIHHKNLCNAVISLNQFLMKLSQFQIKEELELGKPIQDMGNSLNQIAKNFRPQGQLMTTIYEHQDAVSCIFVMKDNRHIISGSYDGSIKIYDLQRIDQDYTADSVATQNCFQGETQTPEKIKTVKMIEDSSSIIYGTDKGIVDIFRLEFMDSTQAQEMDKQKKSKKLKMIQRYEFDGEVKSIQTLNNEFNDKCFIYATLKGEVGVKDIRSKTPAITYNIGKERGLISSMILSKFNNQPVESAVISTLNGYCLIYDIRSNVLSNIFQLQNSFNEQAPIISMSNYYNHVNIDTMDTYQHLIAVSFASQNHEIGFFEINNQYTTSKCALYILSTQDVSETYRIPQLIDMKETNESYTLEDLFHYDFVPDFIQKVDVLKYLKDPLIKKINSRKEKWLDHSKNCFKNISGIYKQQNYANKIICLPQFRKEQLVNQPKNIENSIITAGNDKNIRYFPMTSDPSKQDSQSISRFVKGFHICNVQEKERGFQYIKMGDTNILHEFDKYQIHHPLLDQDKKEIPSSFSKMDKRSYHKDAILDLGVIDRQNGNLIISASRDKTIKIWR